MGSICQGDTKAKTTLPDSKPSVMRSDLYLSQNIGDVINQQKGGLRITGYPIDRQPSQKNSLILPVCKQLSPELLVRFYLIYSFYINKYIKNVSMRKIYQQSFYEMTQISHTQPEEKLKISAFKLQIEKESNDMKKDQIMINTLFKSKFIIQNINKILLYSNDPKDIGHLIFPLARLYKGIKKAHQSNKRKDPLYIVAALETDQEKKLKIMAGKEAYFSFAVFMKGFTQEKDARKKLKQLKQANKKKAALFIVNFPFNQNKLQAEFDYGYFIYKNADQTVKKDGDVVFNIMNTFKVSQNSNADDREYDIQYGYLPYLHYAKYVDRTLNIGDPNLLKIFQLCNAVSSHYLKSQSFLFRIIGGRNDSISVSNAILKSASTDSKGSNDIERQNIINNCLDNREFKQALNTSQQGESFMLKAKRLEITYQNKQFQQAKKLADQLSKSPAKKLKQNSEAEQIIQFIAARLEMREKSYKKALQRLKQLHKKMIRTYGDNYNFIGRDVIASMQQCYSKGNLPPDPQIKSQEWAIKQANINIRGISTSI